MQSTGINLIIRERAAEIGQDLRKIRLQRNLTLDEISEELKIRKFYLEKIEYGDIQNIPGIAYQRLYLKSYCDFLDLPLNYNELGVAANENIQEFSESIQNLNNAQDDNSKSIISNKLVVVVCAILLITLIFFFGIAG